MSVHPTDTTPVKAPCVQKTHDFLVFEQMRFRQGLGRVGTTRTRIFGPSTEFIVRVAEGLGPCFAPCARYERLERLERLSILANQMPAEKFRCFGPRQRRGVRAVIVGTGIHECVRRAGIGMELMSFAEFRQFSVEFAHVFW